MSINEKITGYCPRHQEWDTFEYDHTVINEENQLHYYYCQTCHTSYSKELIDIITDVEERFRTRKDEE